MPEQKLIQVKGASVSAEEHGETCINSIITGNDSWVHHYDPKADIRAQAGKFSHLQYQICSLSRKSYGDLLL